MWRTRGTQEGTMVLDNEAIPKQVDCSHQYSWEEYLAVAVSEGHLKCVQALPPSWLCCPHGWVLTTARSLSLSQSRSLSLSLSLSESPSLSQSLNMQALLMAGTRLDGNIYGKTVFEVAAANPVILEYLTMVQREHDVMGSDTSERVYSLLKAVHCGDLFTVEATQPQPQPQPENRQPGLHQQLRRRSSFPSSSRVISVYLFSSSMSIDLTQAYIVSISFCQQGEPHLTCLYPLP